MSIVKIKSEFVIFYVLWHIDIFLKLLLRVFLLISKHLNVRLVSLQTNV
jgi:hypothetical protein